MSENKKQKDSLQRKQYLGLRGAYEGPPINCSKKIASTKLENKNSNGIPVYLDSKGNFYDLYFLPLNNQKNEINFRNKKISKKEDLDLILNNENQTRSKKNEIYSSSTSQNLENIASFPDPENYQTFEEFELASLEYQELIQEKIGLLQLPQLISSNVYRPKENRTKVFTETDQQTETETDMVTDLTTEIDLVTEAEGYVDFDDETIQQIKFQEDTPTLKQNEELKIYKLLEKGLLNDRLEVKKEEFSIDLKNVLMRKDPWDSELVPPEPKAKFYLKFEEYERAYRRWSQIAIKNIKHLPMHPRQLQHQALLKPYQKKIKQHSKKRFQDFMRDYSSWRNNIIKKIEHIQPFAINFLPFKKNLLKSEGYTQQGLKKKKKRKDIIQGKNPFSFISPNGKSSSSNFRKEVTYKEIWPNLPEKSKTQIENIFDQLYLKITKNQKFYSSNISPILGRYQPVLQESKSYRMKLSNYCIYRTDIKKEIAKTRYKFNQILKESSLNKKYQKIIKDKNNDDVIKGNSYNLGIDDEYQNNFLKNGLSYKNILPVKPRNSTAITDYFLYIYKRLPENTNMIDFNESQLLSEKLYNTIIAQLKRNLTNQSRTICNITRLFQGMIGCLIKMKLIMGTVQNTNTVSSPKKITASFKRLKKLSLKKGQINKSMLSPRSPNKNNNSNGGGGNNGVGNINTKGKKANYINDSYDNDKDNILNIKTNKQTDFQAKTIIVKEVRLLQILTIIKDAPSKAYKCKSLLIMILIDILKVRSVFLDLYQSGLIFERLQEFCSDVRNFNLNKVSWKLFYTLILYHSETMAFLIKKELLKPFIDLLSVTSGVGVVNQLHYFNKLFQLDSIGRQNFDSYPIHQQIRYYESNALKSYRKDCRLFINFFESKLHYTRLNSLYKSYIITFNGAPFLQLSKIYYTIMSKKNCLRLYNEFKKSQEYKVAIIWYSNLLK
ncbi:sca1 complex scaffold protein scaa [Anaeramoeba flamelloides]|uniref:Sca1 complex scaffold protein scaa n=1 Tax=Anaeramoeba flamelloides TaxID=1746091 RepID=A0ABQ8ZAV2_9EUKA|nr:sca1 complex scaffold protein scaa [Anaeramoeba flamelloides]